MGSISLKPYLRTALIAFCGGAVASFLAGMMTSGLAAAYAFVAMWNKLSPGLSERNWLRGDARPPYLSRDGSRSFAPPGIELMQ
jgi:hypothetical protein